MGSYQVLSNENKEHQRPRGLHQVLFARKEISPVALTRAPVMLPSLNSRRNCSGPEASLLTPSCPELPLCSVPSSPFLPFTRKAQSDVSLAKWGVKREGKRLYVLVLLNYTEEQEIILDRHRHVTLLFKYQYPG